MNDDDPPLWDHEHAYLDGLVRVKVHEDLDAGLGGVMFDGSIALSRYLETLRRERGPDAFAGLRVVELGAGTALPSMVIAKLGSPPPARVVTTDVPQCVELIAENAENNGVDRVVVARPLDWKSAAHMEALIAAEGDLFDLVLAADTVYDESCVDPFLRVLERLTRKPGCTVLFSHPSPRVVAASNAFWEKLPSLFRVEKVSPERFVPGFKPGTKQFLKPTDGVFVLSRLVPFRDSASSPHT